MDLDVAPDGREAFVVLRDRVRVVDLESGAERRRLSGHGRGMRSIAVSPDGTTIATADAGGTLLLRRRDGTVLFDEPAHGHPTWQVRPLADRPWLTSFGHDGTARFWSLGGVERGVPNVSAPATRAFAFTEDGTRAVTIAADGRLLRIDLDEGTTSTRRTATPGVVRGLAVDAGTERIAIAREDGAITVIGPSGDERTAAVHDGPVLAIAFTPDGARVVTGGADGLATIVSVDGLGVIECPGHTEPIECIAVEPDGRWFATGGSDHLVRIWDTATGALRHVLRGHTAPVQALASSPDGTLLVSAGEDMTARVWDTSTGEQRRDLLHERPVWSVAWTPDGTRIVTGAGDVAVRIWAPDRDDEVLGLRWPGYFVSHLVVTPDGARIVARSFTGALRTWDAGTGAAREDVVRSIVGRE